MFGICRRLKGNLKISMSGRKCGRDSCLDRRFWSETVVAFLLLLFIGGRIQKDARRSEE
jgi:hypothetical protein